MWSSRGGRSATEFSREVALRNELQRDLALKPRVQRSINLTHTAGTDFLQQAVRSKLCSLSDCHRSLMRSRNIGGRPVPSLSARLPLKSVILMGNTVSSEAPPTPCF